MTTTEQEEIRVLYQVTVSDLSYFKSQQWNVTYYALLVEASLVGIAQLLDSKVRTSDRVVLAILSILAAISALYVIAKLQRSISVRQSRLDAARQLMTDVFKRAWSAEYKDDEKVPNIFLLRGGIVVTALLTLWLVSYRL